MTVTRHLHIRHSTPQPCYALLVEIFRHSDPPVSRGLSGCDTGVTCQSIRNTTTVFRVWKATSRRLGYSQSYCALTCTIFLELALVIRCYHACESRRLFRPYLLSVLAALQVEARHGTIYVIPGEDIPQHEHVDPTVESRTMQYPHAA